MLPADLLKWYKNDKNSSLAVRQALLKSKRVRVSDIEAAIARRLEQLEVGAAAGCVWL